MPDLVFRVQMQNGKPVIQEMGALDAAYKKTGTSGKKAFTEADKAASVFSSGMGQVKDMVLGLGVMFGGLGIAQQIAHWTAAAMEFEAQWAKVTTLRPGTAGFAELKEQLRGLNEDFGDGATRAKGLFAVLKAGIAQADSVKFLATSMRLAQTSFMETEEAVNLLKVSLNSYNLAATEAEETSNTLFKIMRSSGNVGASELSGALARVLPVASSLGVQLADVGAIIAELAKKNIPATQSAQALNIIMMKMSDEGSKVGKALKEMGASFDADTIKTKGFGFVLAKLADTIKGDAELTQELNLPMRQLNALLALASGNGNRYVQVMKDMGVNAGELDDAWTKVNSTLKDKWSDALDAASLRMERLFEDTEALKSVVASLTEAFISGTGWVAKFADAILGLSLAFGTLKLVSIISQLATFQNIIAGIQILRMASNVKELSTAFMLLVGTFNPVIIGLGLLTGAVIYYREEVSTAIAETIRWAGVKLGLVEKLPEVVGVSTDAVKKQAASIGVSVETMERWRTEFKGSFSVFDKYKDKIAEMRVETSKLANGQTIYEKSLEKVMRAEIAATDISDQLADKVRGKIKLNEEEKKKWDQLAESIWKAINPTKELFENYNLFVKGGGKSVDFIKANSKAILEAIDVTQTYGGKVPTVIRRMEDQAKAFEKITEKAEESNEQFKQWQQLEKETIPKAISGLENKELVTNARAMIDNIASAELLKDANLSVVDALQLGVAALRKIDEAFTKNKQSMREQALEFEDSLSITNMAAKAYADLGLTFEKTIGSMPKVLVELASAWDFVSTMLTKKEYTAALENVTRKYIENFERLPESVEASLNQAVMSTDIAVRERLIPVWSEYYKSLRDANGLYAAEYVDQLTKVMLGNNRVLKSEMYPAWQEYIASVQTLYGRLPSELNKTNNKIVDQMDDTAEKLKEAWLQQVSTIFTDFSKGVADMIFDAQSMSDAIVGILKEFGKMAVRTLMEAFMKPFQKMLTRVVDDLMNSISGNMTPSSAGTTAASVAASGFNVFRNAEAGQSGLIKAVTTPGSTATKGFSAFTPDQLKLMGYGTTTGVNAASAGTKAAGAATSGGWLSGALGISGAVGMGLLGSKSGYGKIAGAGLLGITGIGALGALGVGTTATGMAGAAALLGPLIWPIGIAIGATFLGYALAKWARGKSNSEAGVDEIARDYGGIQMQQDMYTELTKSFGFPKDSGKLWKNRGQVAASPQMLDAMFKLAEEQGKLKAFYADLNTAWGGLHKNFTDALQVGELTGDWHLLNEEWKKSTMYADLVKAGLQTQADAMMMDKEQIKEVASSFETMYQAMKKTGEGYVELAEYVKENREDIEAATKTYPILAKQLAEIDKMIVAMKEHAAELAELKSLKEGFQAIKDGLESFKPAIVSSLELFLQEGIVTDDFRKKLVDLGADVSAFENVAGLLKINNYFTSLINVFKETGVVTADLRKIMTEFGADLTVLDNLSELSNLKSALKDIDAFNSGLASMAVNATGLQDVLSGIWNDETVRKLQLEGLDPAVFEKLTKLIGGLNDWTSALAEFEQTGKLTVGGVPEIARQVMEKAGLTSDQLDNVMEMFKGSETKLTDSGKMIVNMLKQYGGVAGKIAATRLEKEGILAISPDLLSKTKLAMDAAFKLEQASVTTYMDAIQAQLQARATVIESAIEDQFRIVSDNIMKAFVTARVSALEELDKIIDKIDEITQATLGLIDAASGNSTSGTGSTAPTGTSNEPVTPVSQGDLLLQTVYGLQEQMAVYQALAANFSSNPAAIYAASVSGFDINKIYLIQEQLNAAIAAYATWSAAQQQVPKAETGGLIRVHDEEVVLDKEQTRNLLRGSVTIMGTEQTRHHLKTAMLGHDMMRQHLHDTRVPGGFQRNAPSPVVVEPINTQPSTPSVPSGETPTVYVQPVFNIYGDTYGIDHLNDRLASAWASKARGGSFRGMGRYIN